MSNPGQPPEGGWAPIRPRSDGEPPQGAPNPWDSPAPLEGDVPPPPSVHIPPPNYVPRTRQGGPVLSGSSAGAGGKGITPASVGRRAPSIALVGGLGLVGLLVTVAIMALLADRVLSGTDDAGDALTGTMPPALTSAATAPTDSDAPATTAATVPEGPTGAATAAACQVDRTTLDTAIQAYELTTGVAPIDQSALVAAGLLDGPLSTFTLAAAAAGVEVIGVGECAGL